MEAGSAAGSTARGEGAGGGQAAGRARGMEHRDADGAPEPPHNRPKRPRERHWRRRRPLAAATAAPEPGRAEPRRHGAPRPRRPARRAGPRRAALARADRGAGPGGRRSQVAARLGAPACRRRRPGPGASSLLLRRGRLKRNVRRRRPAPRARPPAPGPAAAPPCSRSLTAGRCSRDPGRCCCCSRRTGTGCGTSSSAAACTSSTVTWPPAACARCSARWTPRPARWPPRLLQAGPRAGGVLKVPGRPPRGRRPGRPRCPPSGAAAAPRLLRRPRACGAAARLPRPRTARAGPLEPRWRPGPSPGAEAGASRPPDPYCSSSSEELEADPGQPAFARPLTAPGRSPRPPPHFRRRPRGAAEGLGGAARDRPAE